ncbi:coiled-coil domain-containing protein 50 isoform X1 [Lepisosteus oculatus]|uniref:coiled-coil domain-containing protein 50 isoform X1 n=1 Tax=Lepisosteus oculatus TaxID=7918 RepID=UPI0035F52FFE
MADFTSIDQNKLPGVKEVCRDFAVLEDHALAHNLQEQEIESHLASNIHKSRLVQQDLQVAKKLQEEEDLRAKVRIQRKHRDIERSDNEIAQEIQEQLVKQAEQQRQQEEKDEAIARKLQEKEMKEERRRMKQLQEAPYEESYYDEKGEQSRGRHPERLLPDSRKERGHYSHDRDRRHRPESRGSQSTFYADGDVAHRRDELQRSPPRRAQEPRQESPDSERVVRRKERPPRPPSPQFNRVRHREHSREHGRGRNSQEDHYLGPNRTRSAEESVDDDDWVDRQGQQPQLDEVFEEHKPLSHRREERREHVDQTEEAHRTHSHSREDRHHRHHPKDPGRKARGDYGMREVTQSVARMDLREQELRDLEVARRLQEEELKASQLEKRAAQVAQDEEIARLIMEEEKKVYKRSKEREKGYTERRRHEAEWKLEPEEVVRPRSREECEYQRPRQHKPARPPPPVNDYENVDSTYAYPRSSCSPRPEAAYKVLKKEPEA